MTTFWRRERAHYQQVIRLRKFYNTQGLTSSGEAFIEALIKALYDVVEEDEPLKAQLKTSNGELPPNLSFSYAGFYQESDDAFVSFSTGELTTGEEFVLSSLSRLGGALVPPTDPQNFRLEIVVSEDRESYSCERGVVQRNGNPVGYLEVTPDLSEICSVPELNFVDEKLTVEAHSHRVSVRPWTALKLF